MNTLPETIPTAIDPETAFNVALGDKSERRDDPNESFVPHRFALPLADQFARRGIPASALHD